MSILFLLYMRQPTNSHEFAPGNFDQNITLRDKIELAVCIRAWNTLVSSSNGSICGGLLKNRIPSPPVAMTDLMRLTGQVRPDPIWIRIRVSYTFRPGVIMEMVSARVCWRSVKGPRRVGVAACVCDYAIFMSAALAHAGLCFFL